jgi:C-terminal processing protease CtpA/Prc
MEIENPYMIKNMDKKIAVLIGKATASSGEATAVSFIGKEDTRFFGVETAGLTTGNAAFELKDGARLFLTTTIYVDRNKKKYGATIKPDYATFQARKKAIEWIIE